MKEESEKIIEHNDGRLTGYLRMEQEIEPIEIKNIEKINEINIDEWANKFSEIERSINIILFGACR